MRKFFTGITDPLDLMPVPKEIPFDTGAYCMFMRLNSVVW